MTIQCERVHRLWIEMASSKALTAEELSFIEDHLAVCPSCQLEAKVALEMDLNGPAEPLPAFDSEAKLSAFVESTLSLAQQRPSREEEFTFGQIVPMAHGAAGTRRIEFKQIVVLAGIAAGFLLVLMYVFWATSGPAQIGDGLWSVSSEPPGDSAPIEMAKKRPRDTGKSITVPPNMPVDSARTSTIDSQEKSNIAKAVSAEDAEPHSTVIGTPQPGVEENPPANTGEYIVSNRDAAGDVVLTEVDAADTALSKDETEPVENKNPPDQEPKSLVEPVFQSMTTMMKRRTVGATLSYPAEAYFKGIESALVVEIHVGKEGKVTNYKFIEEGNKVFHQTVAQAIEKWRFAPQIIQGKPVETYSRFKFRFEIRDSSIKAQAINGIRSQHRSLVVGKWMDAQAEKAYRLFEEKQYSHALEVLDDLKKYRHLISQERALMWQILGHISVSEEGYQKAIGAFEKSIAAQAMTKDATLHTEFILGQLHLAIKEYGKAIKLFEGWLKKKEKPTPLENHIVAMAYYRGKKYRQALHFAKKAVAGTTNPPKSWSQLVFALENKQYHLYTTSPVYSLTFD